MNHCNTCRFWQAHPNRSDVGICALTLATNDALVFPRTLAWAEDPATRAGARLVTMPEFGCVQHEERRW
jgi:hypothetical protein